MTIANDKRLHAAGGVVVAIFVVALDWLARSVGLWAACLAAGVAVAVGWEVLQRYRGDGSPSPEDAAAGIVGSAIAAVVVYLVSAVP